MKQVFEILHNGDFQRNPLDSKLLTKLLEDFFNPLSGFPWRNMSVTEITPKENEDETTL